MQKKSVQLIISLVLLGALAALVVACGSGQAALTGQAAAQTATTGAPGGITVVGQGEAFGEPDEAQVQVGVETFAPTVSEATSQNQTTLDQIMAALTGMGIAAEDIQTTNYSLWAEQIYGDRGPEGIAGYRVSNMVSVKIRDINQVSDVLGAVTEAGANSIYGVSFTVADPAALEAEARANAMADAQARAQSLADLAGVSLGDVVLVSEVIGQSAPVPYGLGGGAMMAAEQAASAPGISPGQLSYHVQVQVTYGMQ